MPGLKRLWSALLLLAVACLPLTALAWLAETPEAAQAGGEDVPVLAQAAGAPAAGQRLRFRGGQLEARLRFTLPAADGERRVLWLSRDAFDEVRVSAPGWAPAPQRYFAPGRLGGLLPAGYAFALPRDWTGPREVRLALRGGVRAAPTPRVLGERQVLALVARDNALAYAVYAALLTLAIAALALFAAVRDGPFLLFALHAGAALLVCATVNGHLYGVPGLGLLGRLGAPGFWATLLLFAGVGLLTVLRYAGTAGRGLRLAPWLLLAAAALVAALGRAWPQALHPLATAGWVAAATLALVAVFGAARRGVSMAVAVLLALVLLATAAGAHELLQAGRLPDGLWPRYGYQLALVLLSLLLFVGLSSRIGLVRQRLDDEASARRDSDQRLRHERLRAALAQALQAELRSAPDEAIAPAAFRLLAEHAAQLAGREGALVLAEGYRGAGRLLVPAGITPRPLLRAVEAAQPTLRACAGQRTAS
ncbi:MAG TPA: 7TM diverse intracellular signaling domain-containing protein, partial [Thermomonas sp.]|nr:7TM diverse intracellular signaling domain-containing protein [Thermomonas sp.]